MGKVPSKLEEQIQSQKNEGTLTRWIKLAAKAESIEDFEQKISEE